MTVTQSQNVTNLKQTDVSSTSMQIDSVAYDYGFTSAQTYYMITGFFLTLLLIIFIIYQLGRVFVEKSCIGCKRLAKCEKEVKALSIQIKSNEKVDLSMLKEVAEELKKLRDKLVGDTNG